MSGNVEEIVFPEINKSDIKIKKISKKLSEKKRVEQERKDALEYLTILSYLVANNSPKNFQTQDDVRKILDDLSIESISGLISGNKNTLDDLSKRGEKMLEELKNIQVPEAMLDVHVKALQMAQYGVQLKQEIKPSDSNDPLGQIKVLSRVQGFFGSITSLATEMQQKLSDYNIQDIPFEP